jgi:tetratricopeptide (TPR) repeat protein
LFRGIYYHPEEEDYIYNLTEVFLLLGRKEDAEKYATKMMEMKEPSHQAFFRAGHIAYIMGHRDLAIKHYLKGGEYFYEAESFVKDLLPFPRDPEVLKECLDTGLFEDLKVVEPYGLTKQKIEEMEQIVFNELRKWNRSGVF